MPKNNIGTLISQAIRKLWSRSDEKKQALLRARIKNEGEGKHKFLVVCERCGKQMKLGERIRPINKDGKLRKTSVGAYCVHHIEKIPKFTDLRSVGEMCVALWCPSKMLQVLCFECHREIHSKKEKN